MDKGRLKAALERARGGEFLGRFSTLDDMLAFSAIRDAAEAYLVGAFDAGAGEQPTPEMVTVWRLVIQTGAGGTLVRQYDDKETAEDEAVEWLHEGHTVLELKPVEVPA